MMFLKITFIAIVAFVATADGADDVWDGFTAKWAEDVADGFYQLPTTLTQAMLEGWTSMSGPKTRSGVTLRFYKDDPRIGLFFATRGGKLRGHQIALPVADIEKSGVPIDYTANPAITVKTYNGQDYYTAIAMYTNDNAGNRQIWLEVDGELVEFPTKTELVTSQTPYYSKRCIKWMGHHFYQINSTTDISNIFPWFLLSVGDDVVGIGFQAIGTVTSGAQRTWFETIPATQIAETIPDAPAAIGEGIQEYGLISFHFWFKKDPTAIQCSDECTAVYNGTEISSGYQATRKRRAVGSGNVC